LIEVSYLVEINVSDSRAIDQFYIWVVCFRFTLRHISFKYAW
jgi:hypothetical protein